MKLEEAKRIIGRGRTERGYAVDFEWREGGLLRSDHFPDWFNGEPLLEDEQEAWRMAEALAGALGSERICNVRVWSFEVLEGRRPTMLDGSARRLLPR